MINNIHPCTPVKKRGGADRGTGQRGGGGGQQGGGGHTHVIKAHKILNERKNTLTPKLLIFIVSSRKSPHVFFC